MKRLLSLNLVLVMLLGLIPTTAFATGNETTTAAADSGTCGEALTWELTEDGTLTISGTGAMHAYEYGEMTPWASHLETITKVIVEEGVTTIGDYAFNECTKIVSVTLPDSLISIGFRAFYSCRALTTIEIPQQVSFLSPGAFGHCTNLKEISIDAENLYYKSVDGIVWNLTGDKLITVPAGHTGEFVIPDGTKTVGLYAFWGCENLDTVKIPQSVTSIEASAFSHCSGLTYVTIPDSVTTIDQEVFNGCSNLTEVNFEGDAPTINRDAFFEVIATCYYPANNDTWATDVMQPYGGALGWFAVDGPVYILTLHGNGGTTMRGAESHRCRVYYSVATGANLQLTNFFVNGEKTQVGWGENATGTGVTYSYSWADTVYFPAGVYNMPLYVLWDDTHAEITTITYRLSDLGTQSADVVKLGGTYTLPEETRDGYTFDGWRGEDGTLYTAGASVEVTKSTTYTAEYTKIDTGEGDGPAEEQPSLMFRYVERFNGVWTERSEPLAEISALRAVELNNTFGVRLYYGTSTDAVLVDSLVSQNTDVVTVASEAASDGKNFFLLSGTKLGSVNLTCSIKNTEVAEFTATVDLPRQGFYSAAERKAEYYLSNLTLTGTNSDSDKIWYISTISETGNTITAKVGDSILASVEKDSTDYYILEITLPTDITASPYEINVYRNNMRMRGIRVTQPEQPSLMFRYVEYFNGVWTERSEPLIAISNLSSVAPSGSICLRLYYGTSTEAVPVDSVSSGNSAVVTVASELAADDKPFYRLSGTGFGEAVIICSIGNVTESFNATVDLPYYGFYSSNQPSKDAYLTEITLTGEETDLTKVWFIGKGSLKLKESDVISVMVGETAIESFTANDDWSVLEITLPSEVTSMYFLSILRNGSRMQGIRVTPPSGGNQSGGGGMQQDLPDFGFYSANDRTGKDYLPDIVLTGGESDLTKVWFIGKNSLKNNDADIITVFAGGTDITSTNVTVVDERTLEITIPTDLVTSMYSIEVKRNGDNLFGIRVTLSIGGGNNTQQNYAVYKGDYVIGFARDNANGQITTIHENAGHLWSHGTSPEFADGKYIKAIDIKIAAATKTTENGNTVYTVDQDVTATLKIVELQLETVFGDEAVYSLSDKEVVKTLTPSGNSAILYEKNGYAGVTKIYAKISGTANGEPFEAEICTSYFIGLTNIGSSTRPADDTVEKLNAYLVALASEIGTQGVLQTINLAATTYTGTIVIPESLKAPNACLHIFGASGRGQKTVVEGSIDLNGAHIEEMGHIHFRAAEGQTTPALYGSDILKLHSCSFYDYDVALNSKEGLLNIYQNVFVNNGVAARVELEKVDNKLSSADWRNNTFINNETAVQIISLCGRISPYFFRVYDSNFINNGTDIDAQCGGTLYMYRNYFGRYKEVDGHRPHPGKHHDDRHNGRDHLRLDELLNARTESKLNSILEYARAKVSTKNGTQVIANPRRMHPVKNWWGHGLLVSDTFFGPLQGNNAVMMLDAELEYTDTMIADWESETVILNEEASALTLDAAAFDRDGQKEIGVVDENETTIGTWNFSK